ncbi:FxSxx-COOH system tetratricopeptide repeat protein [Sphaerisporangium rubeum]|uniref:FxSxx-COOH system tetratricopeptide repeat protein n=1 Tax=Sphaerisporangium rubeum TaxID=321317 RepID=UPI003CD08734
MAGSAAPAGGFHTGVQIGDAFYQAQTIHVHPREHPPRAFGAEVPGAAWPDPRVPESGAPRRVRYFVGRERELTELRGLMEAGRASASVVAVHGMPGMGKTQFALEYARRFSADYSRMWWIAAGRPELLGEQFGGMATALGLAVQGDMRTVCAVLFDALRDHGRWLLVFDDAPDAEAVQAYVPASDALHVLITSRNPEWSALAAPLALGPLAAEESRELMSALLHEPGTTRAAPIAERLGHLPLAVAQTALFLRGAPLDPEEYAEELGSRTAGALDTKPVPGYGRTLAAVWTLSMDSLARSSPAAAELLRACAYLGDAPVPWNLLAAAAADLPEPLRAVAASPLRLAEAATDAARLGLLRIEGTSVRVHGLLQAFLRDTDPGPVPDLRPALARAHPGDPRDPCSWPGYGTVLPHALALDLPGSDDPACHRLHLDALRYLAVRGDTRTVLRLATEVRDRWRDTLGPDAEPVLDAAGLLSRAHHDLGAHREALVLDQEVYDRRGRLLGPGDPATLTAGHNLAVDLSALARGGDAPAGIAARAVELLETVVDARREVLGPRHPETLRSVHNLAAELHAEGRRDQARELCEEALSGLTEALEPDHPDVLRSAHLLALLLAGDEPERARRLNEDTLRRRAKVLGPRHLDTLRSAHSHARDLLLAGFPVLAAGQAKETWLAVCATAGEDHPEALRAAGLTARALRATGDHAGAYRLSEDTYRRSVRLLGEDHIETLRAADQYATDLRTAGELATAGDLTRRTTAALARLVRSRRPSPPDA